MMPNFLLIGPGRTGTTWVTKNLMLHPDIFIPRCKSTRFFIDQYHRGTEWYESHFKRRRERAIGEASVGYFANHDAADLIRRHIPDVKMIATFRDPVDRAYSSLGRLRAFAKPGEEDLSDFESKIQRTPRLIDQGKYATHLEYYWSMFPKENILITFYEQLKRDPHGYLRQIYEFLGVDPSFVSPLLTQQINATSTVSATSRVSKSLYKVLLRLDLFKLSKRVDDSMQIKSAPLSPEVRQRVLTAHYLDEIARLEKMLNLDLSRWREIR